MLKIKDCLFNKDEIKYIKPSYRSNLHNPYTIEIIFIDNHQDYIVFDSEIERDEELNRVLEKAGGRINEC